MKKKTMQNKLSTIYNKIAIKPNKQNSFIWFNVLFVLALLFTGKADGKGIVFAFFFETISIGIFHVFKLYSVYRYNKAHNTITRKEDGLFAPIFFSFHYGFFVAIQLIFVFVFMDIGKRGFEPFHLIENLTYVIIHHKGVKLLLIILFISNFLDYYFNFIQNEIYKTVKMDKLFFQPYVRVLVQQLAVILGGFFMFFIKAINVIAILIILIKSLLDLYFISNPKANIFTNKEKLKI